jgi:hypothetical protein
MQLDNNESECFSFSRHGRAKTHRFGPKSDCPEYFSAWIREYRCRQATIHLRENLVGGESAPRARKFKGAAAPHGCRRSRFHPVFPGEEGVLEFHPLLRTGNSSANCKWARCPSESRHSTAPTTMILMQSSKTIQLPMLKKNMSRPDRR